MRDFGRKYYFITIVEEGNITKAAQVLSVSQPSLSQYITHLEELYQTKLIYRNCTPLKLTKSGELYMEYLKKCYELEEDFKKTLKEYRDEDINKLNIGIPAQVTTLIFRYVVEDFIQSKLNAQVSIKGGSSISMIEQIQKGVSDVAFFHIRNIKPSDIEFQVLKEEKLFLVCSAKNNIVAGRKSSRRNPIILTDEEKNILENQRFMILSKDFYLREVCEDYFKEAQIQPKNTMELSTVETILDYICSNGQDSVALIPSFAFHRRKNMEKLAFLQIKNVCFVWDLVIGKNKNKQLNALGQEFWNCVVSKNWDI